MPFRSLFRKPPLVSTSSDGQIVSRDVENEAELVCTTRRRLSAVSVECGFESDGALKIESGSVAELVEYRIGSVRSVGTTSLAGHVPTNPNKVNQDRFWVTELHEKSGSRSKFCGVADGHGVHGHHVAEMVRTQLAIHVEKQLPLYAEIRAVLTNSFLRMNKDIMESYLDVSFSGAAAVAILIKDKKIYCANLGDSRAILGSHHGSDWKIIPLSRDHKPDLAEELLRINRSGGRVAAYRSHKGDALGPARVWLKTRDVPGLAMSRSFGDKVAATVGVVGEPEIIEHTLKPEDKIVVIASDGVWEFLTNDEVLKLILPFYKSGDARAAADCVCKEAVDRWKSHEEVIDDITALILFL